MKKCGWEIMTMSKKWENAMRIEKMEHKILNSDMRWSDIILVIDDKEV